jgi:tRNA threonylcarbamoyl adenosine modification protein (Sua5/YciO/YrdC/YwlC family)
MAEIIRIYPDNPNPKELEKVVKILSRGGVIVYPTDTVYSFGCDISKPKAIERIARLKGLKPEKAEFAIIFYDLSNLSEFTKSVDTPTYKILKRCLPGPFTFILSASNAIPKFFQKKRKTIGIRSPDNNIPREIVSLLGNPIIASSVHDDDSILEYTTDPELIAEKFDREVDLVIDGGMGNLYASTVVDLSNGEVEIIREGRGDISLL